MFITEQMLIELAACDDQLALFTKLFPNGVEVNPELCVKYAHDFNFDWASEHLLTPPQQEEYNIISEAAGAEFERILGAARAEYERICAAARAEVDRDCVAEWEEYERIRDAAWAEYERTCAAAFAHSATL